MLFLPTAHRRALAAPLQRELTGAQLEDLPAAQTLVSFVEHGELRQEGVESVRIIHRLHLDASAVTCPGVRARTVCDSVIHREQSAFRVTVQGTEEQRDLVVVFKTKQNKKVLKTELTERHLVDEAEVTVHHLGPDQLGRRGLTDPMEAVCSSGVAEQSRVVGGRTLKAQGSLQRTNTALLWN